MLIVDIRPKQKIKRVYRRKAKAQIWAFKKRSLFGLVGSAVLLILASLPLIFAFEAHVINVTAQIEGCDEFEIRSRGFWKNHDEFWVLPQTVGAILISAPEEAEEMLNANDDATDRLERELLALKFNMAHFGVGDALVPGEDIRISELAAEADTLLIADFPEPDPVTDQELEAMKDRVEMVNNAKHVSTCKEPPKEHDPCERDDHHNFPHLPDLPDLPGHHSGGDGGVIITGDACAESEIENVVNTNITEINTCEGDCSGSHTIIIENINNAEVENNATTTAETGDNSADGGDEFTVLEPIPESSSEILPEAPTEPETPPEVPPEPVLEPEPVPEPPPEPPPEPSIDNSEEAI